VSSSFLSFRGPRRRHIAMPRSASAGGSSRN